MRANQKKARQLALRSCCRLERDGVHAGDFEEARFQELQDFQAALRKVLRLVGMLCGDPVEASDKFVYARVVLHSAGTQWVHPQVDRIIPVGKPRKVANHFNLANLGKALDAFAAVCGAQRLCRVDGRHIEGWQFKRALSRRRFLENQSLILIGLPPRLFDHLRHCSPQPVSVPLWLSASCFRYFVTFTSIRQSLFSLHSQISQSLRAWSSPLRKRARSLTIPDTPTPVQTGR